MVLVLLSAISVSMAQKPRSTPRPTPKPSPGKPRPIVFAVIDGGKMIEPIAYIANGKLAEATNSASGQNSFTSIYYKPNTNYTVVFGGAAKRQIRGDQIECRFRLLDQSRQWHAAVERRSLTTS